MKFKINGIKFEIVEIDQLDYKKFRVKDDEQEGLEISEVNKGVYFGATHHKSCKIYLDKNMPKDRKRKVLLHELTHCYIYEFIGHELQNFTEEDVADIVANSHDLIHKIVEDYFK